MVKKGFLFGLLLVSVVALAAEPRIHHKALPQHELETVQDRPALVWRRGVSPRMISQYDAFTSYQVNVNASGQNITGDAANEPSICVDPTNPNKMAIGWRQFDSVSSNFRQSGYGYTSNAGVNWTFPGDLESGVFRSDPVLDADDTGNFFYLSLLETFYDDMWRSINGGQSWTNLAPAKGGDKQWFTIDRTASTGHGFQYQFWSSSGNNYNGRQFTRSLDGGFTWLNPVNIPHQPAWGTLDVDSNGLLYIGGVNLNTGQVWCIRSSNARNSAMTPSFDLSTAVNLGGDIDSFDTINPEGLSGQVFIAVDRSGTSLNNNVYMLASVQPTGFTTGADVMFVRSTDNGQTFSTPVRINDDPVNHAKWHWLGTLDVAPNGRIDVVWLDSRNAANNTDSQLYYSYSYDGGATWAPNVAISNSFNPFIGYPNQNKMGDYITIVSDNNGGSVAYTATFNGEEDIYYVRVAPIAPTALGAVSRKTHGSAGTYDVPLPLSGTPGIEPRIGPGHQIVVTFAAPVTVTSAAVTSGTGAVSSYTVSGSQVTINLTAVTNAQTLTVTLRGVDDGTNLGDVPVSMSVLLGDINASGQTNATDVSVAKATSGATANAGNFRADITADGNINATDISQVKNNSGSHLP